MSILKVFGINPGEENSVLDKCWPLYNRDLLGFTNDVRGHIVLSTPSCVCAGKLRIIPSGDDHVVIDIVDLAASDEINGLAGGREELLSAIRAVFMRRFGARMGVQMHILSLMEHMVYDTESHPMTIKLFGHKVYNDDGRGTLFNKPYKRGESRVWDKVIDRLYFLSDCPEKPKLRELKILNHTYNGLAEDWSEDVEYYDGGRCGDAEKCIMNGHEVYAWVHMDHGVDAGHVVFNTTMCKRAIVGTVINNYFVVDAVVIDGVTE